MVLAYDHSDCLTVGLLFGMGAHQISSFPDNTCTQSGETCGPGTVVSSLPGDYLVFKRSEFNCDDRFMISPKKKLFGIKLLTNNLTNNLLTNTLLFKVARWHQGPPQLRHRNSNQEEQGGEKPFCV